MSPAVKWLIGCTVGCFLFILVGCGGLFAVSYWLGQKMAKEVERMNAAAAAAKARAGEIDQFDVVHPPTLPEDVAFAEVTEEDIQRYLRVRRELAPAMQALSDAVHDSPFVSPATLGDRPSFKQVVGAMKGAYDGIGKTQAAHQALLDAASTVLAREQVGPTDLARMAEIVEWRFLQRPEAAALGLPAFRRKEIVRLQVMVRIFESALGQPGTPGVDDNTRARMQRELDDARGRLTEVLAESGRNTSLLETTRARLDAHRAELEALPVAAITAIAPLTAESPWSAGANGGGTFGAHGEWHYSTDSSGETAPAGESAPADEEAPAPESAPAGESSPQPSGESSPPGP